MPDVKYTERKKVRFTSIVVEQADADMFTMIQEFLGCSKSEAIRTCIRITATHLPLKTKS